MENYYAQVAVAALTGETADVNVNVFAVQCASTLDGTKAAAWRDALITFYDECLTQGAMRGRARTGHTVKFLKATRSVPNYPLFQYDWALVGTPPALDLPAEVALCASYANDTEALVPRARRRGRIYISGWASSINASGRPVSAGYNGLEGAYSDYCIEVNGIGDLTAGVWSRTTGDVFKIDRVWVDNEWDTQRRRGGKATVRATQVIL